MRIGTFARASFVGTVLLGTVVSLTAPGRLASAGDATDAASYREFDVGDGRVTFDVTDVSLKQLVADRIQPKTRVNIFIAPEAEAEKVSLRVVDLHWVHVLDAMVAKIGGVIVRKDLRLLQIERPTPVTMSFTNEDVQQVIKTIGSSAGANITVSPAVQGTVTVNFTSVPWRAALKYVVETAGNYSLVEEDYGVLRVVPTEQLELASDSYTFRYLRPPPPYKGIVKGGASGGTSSSSSGGGGSGGSASVGADIIENNVFVPSDDPSKAESSFPIVAALRAIVDPDGGRVVYIPGSNAILFTGKAPHVRRIKQICEQLDIEPPQVFIDMNFISTSLNDTTDFGMQSDSGIQMGVTGAGIQHRLPFAASGGGWSDFISGTAFPPPSAAGFNYGTLDFTQTNMLFKFLKQNGCSKIIQAPKILALDNQEATIFVGESIRYARSTAASNQNGGLTFSVEEDQNSPVNVGFQLLVIPHVIPGENKIMLLVIPQQRSLSGTTSPIPGFERLTVSGQTIDLPRVASSTMVTQMILRDKETAVIGGLLEDRDTNSQDKVPGLGDLPILGLLFRGQSKAKIQRNLIITITPQILRGSDAANTTMGDELSGRSERLKGQWDQLGSPSQQPCQKPGVVMSPAPVMSAPMPAPMPVSVPAAPVPVAPAK